MTAMPVRARRRPSWTTLTVLSIAFAISAMAGAYFDWYLWHPMSGITITIAAIFILLVAVVLWVTRARILRQVAGVALAIGLGLIAGQVLGPSRPPLAIVDGTMTLRVTEPTPFERTGPAHCSMVSGDGQVSVSADINRFGRTEGSTEDFVGAYVSVGDMWDYQDQAKRSDHVSLMLSFEPAAVPADGGPLSTHLTSDPASTMSARLHEANGSIDFANLTGRDDATGAPTGHRSPLSGTITWTCDAVGDTEPVE